MVSVAIEQPKMSGIVARSVGRRVLPKIPDELVRETIGGVPFYYRGFRSVLNKTKTLEEIMADSAFQIGLKNELADFLKLKLGKERYRIWSGEAGMHLRKNTNLGLDVVVFDKNVLTKEKIDKHYIDVPPELVIEIDIDIEMADKSKNPFMEYVLPKTEELLGFGVKKVVWIFSQERKFFVASATERFKTLDWSQPLELMPGAVLEIDRLIAEAEIG